MLDLGRFERLGADADVGLALVPEPGPELGLDHRLLGLVAAADQAEAVGASDGADTEEADEGQTHGSADPAGDEATRHDGEIVHGPGGGRLS